MGLRRALLVAVTVVAGLLVPGPAQALVTPGGGSGTARPTLALVPVPVLAPPRVVGPQRLGATVRVRAPRLGVEASQVRYQWLRGDTPIAGETGRRHEVAPGDVGSRLRVEVTVSAPGHDDTVLLSRRRGEVEHRRPARRTVSYSVETRGPVTASVAEFARLAQRTYDDPRGWRGAGIAFRRVARGGAFTLVLATPEQLPRFSGVCSVQWSCRVGRFVVINQTRWQQASPAWNAAGGSLRDYRHMVVDHETGHWLGLGHSGCPGAGAPAPVMMQQSKGLAGCRFNPFPTLAELSRVS